MTIRQTRVRIVRIFDGVTNEYRESINSYVDRLPAQPPFWPEGKLLFLPRIEMVVVPVVNHSNDGWDVIVVAAKADNPYQPGGHRLYVGAAEIAAGVPFDLDVQTFG